MRMYKNTILPDLTHSSLTCTEKEKDKSWWCIELLYSVGIQQLVNM